jgi:hypothetical protein
MCDQAPQQNRGEDYTSLGHLHFLVDKSVSVDVKIIFANLSPDVSIFLMHML